jgi:hypothetical protein
MRLWPRGIAAATSDYPPPFQVLIVTDSAKQLNHLLGAVKLVRLCLYPAVS